MVVNFRYAVVADVGIGQLTDEGSTPAPFVFVLAAKKGRPVQVAGVVNTPPVTTGAEHPLVSS